jgi:hypothetical protein
MTMGRPLGPIKHGIVAGYRAHQRRNIPIPADDSCGCRAANREAVRKSRAKAPVLPLERVPITAALRTSLTPGGWRDRAACDNHPTLPPATWDDHVDDETGPQRVKRVAAAKAACRACAVRAECMADVELEFDSGVRGGEDLREVRWAKSRGRTA